MRVHERVLVPVSVIRYSQDFILPYFEETKRSLQETVEQIVTGKLSPENLPRMILWLYGELFFTHNNRLLWVYQKSKVQKIVAKVLYPRQTGNVGRRWMTFEHSENYIRYKDPHYIPVIRLHVGAITCQNGSSSNYPAGKKPFRRSWNPAKPVRKAVEVPVENEADSSVE